MLVVTLVKSKWLTTTKKKVVGIGNIILTTNMACKLVLKDARHVSNIRLNIISASKLDGHVKMCHTNT